MYSVTSRQSFEEVDRYLQMVYRLKDADQFTAPPIILLGNKVDREGERQVSPAEVRPTRCLVVS
jgi:GTPase SAR1 family protein